VLDFDFNPETPDWSKRLGVFDLETTGLDTSTARIVSACVAVLDANGELEGQPGEWLVNPGVEIPDAASSVHGITNERAQAEGQDAATAVGEIAAALRELFNSGIAVVAFNAPYDFTMLHHELARYGLPTLDPKPVIDPLVLDRAMIPRRRGKRTLGVLTADYGVKLVDAHNSTADAIAAGRLAQQQAAKFERLGVNAQELHRLQVGWSEAQSRDFAEYMKQHRPDFVAEIGWPLRP
jgi:DNA polymerase III subunit epsilon